MAEQRKFAWWAERDAIAIVKRTVDSGSKVYNSPSEIKTVTVFGVKRPNLFVAADSGTANTTTGMTEEPDIPAEFHHTIVAKAIQRGYELDAQTLNAATYWERQFDKGVLEGKRHANTGRVQKPILKLHGFEPTSYPSKDKDES